MSENPPRTEELPEDDAQSLTGEPVSATPMRLRAEPPRVTRLSRKVLAGIGLVTSVGLGGALVYALQTRDVARPNEELYSTENRSTADGLAGLPRDYKRYVLSYPTRLQPPGLSRTSCDALVEFWFDGVAGMMATFAHPHYLTKVRPDEHRFMDMDRSSFVVTREVVVIQHDPSIPISDGD